MKKLFKSFILIALAIVFLGNLPAQADTEVEDIFRQVRALNPDLIDYQANIYLSVQAKWAFIPYSPKLSGRYYHKQPDKNKLVLEEAPSFIKNQPNAFGFSLPDLEKYNSKVVRKTTFNGQPVWDISLLPKKDGSITSIQILVNCDNYTVPRQITNYKDNGKLVVDSTYTVVDKFWVFNRMHGEFSFPKVKVQATADATYTNYKFNQGLSDSFFEVKK